MASFFSWQLSATIFSNVAWKGKLSPLFYITAIGASFWAHWLAQFIYVLVALVWLVPDKRIERIIIQTEE